MTTALAIKSLKKTYANGTSALKGIDLTVEEGDFFALLGPNGAGKSTTIGIITSLVNKTEGHVSIFGHDLDNEKEAAKACIGVVPQEFNFNIFVKIFDCLVTQAGYYGVPLKTAKTTAEFFLHKLDLWQKRDNQIRTLSGGQKRRLMIARALMHQPRLLILDEPTAGVDIEIRRAMWDFIKELNKQGTTVVLTTHYLEEAENLCKNIAIINHGEIVENTSMRALLRKLNIETFVLNLADPIHFAPELKDFTCRLVDETTLEIDLHRTQSLNALFTEINQNTALQVMSLRNKANRLEELFIRLINHHASE